MPSPPPPKGSGYFAVLFAALFLVTFICSTILDFSKLNSYVAFQAWLLLAAVILAGWGINRVRTGRADMQVGQSTINFVVGVIAATIALFTLVIQNAGVP
jgi:hypothetical protein